MSNDLEKDVPQVLALSAQHMRKMAHDNTALTQKNAQLALELRLHKIAMRMEERNLDADVPLAEKVAKLRDIPEEKLGSFEQALELGVGGYKLGSIESSELNESEGASSSAHQDLDAFIRSGAAFG